jgi:exodeoxyribonuclease-3
MVRIATWNVNGIRAWHTKAASDWFLKAGSSAPDVLFLQETKAEPHQYPKELTDVPGYHLFTNHSKGRKGYSGVAVYTKFAPERVEYGLSEGEIDQEGRVVALLYKHFAVIGCYFPNGGGGPERLKYKLEFYERFFAYIENLRSEGLGIVFVGDVNTAHTEIDLARPKENVDNTGFLPVERAWIDRLIEAGYIDTFRALYPDTVDAYTYWDMKTRARDRNVGWRIDYIFASDDVVEHIQSVRIDAGAHGSDHCPVVADFNIEL